LLSSNAEAPIAIGLDSTVSPIASVPTAEFCGHMIATRFTVLLPQRLPKKGSFSSHPSNDQLHAAHYHAVFSQHTCHSEEPCDEESLLLLVMLRKPDPSLSLRMTAKKVQPSLAVFERTIPRLHHPDLIQNGLCDIRCLYSEILEVRSCFKEK
jgi:hypothetical protein